MRFMRRNLMLLTLLLAGMSSAIAGQVGEQKARKKALAFLNGNSGTRGVTTGLSRVYLPLTTKAAIWSASEAPLYVFNREGGGYVIVSGDDRTAEILAFSEKGHIDTNRLPVNMRNWLQGYVDQIERLASGTVVLREAGTRTGGAKTTIKPKLKTTWGQEYPYNLHAPELTFTWEKKEMTLRAATGCIATASAQILNFYKYPEATLKEIKGYSGETDIPVVTSDGLKNDTIKNVKWKIEAVPAGTKIDWENIVDDYDLMNYGTGKPSNKYNNTDAQREAVSKLMLYCGMGAEMDYGFESSSTWNGPLVHALQEVLGYQDVYVLNQFEYKEYQDWVDAVYEELSKAGPVMLGGQTPTQGGHKFILDGYQYKDNNHYFYANWGWDGEDDGYVLLNVMSPGWIKDDAGHEEGFTEQQDVICGLGPKGKGVTTCQAPALYLDDLSIGAEGKTYTRSSQSEPFMISDFYMACSNIHTPSCTMVPAIGVIDKNGNPVSAVIFADIDTGIKIDFYHYMSVDSRITTDKMKLAQEVGDGTYQVTGILINLGAKNWNKEWTLMQNSESFSLTMTINGNNATFTNSTPTAIVPVASKALQEEDNQWYSLSGARISGQPSAKGIYVKNGKKVLVR